MAGQANGGQVVPPKGVNTGNPSGNPMDMGRYVGNPNHIAQQQAVQNPNHPMYMPQPTDMGGGNAFSGNTTGGSGSRFPTGDISGEIGGIGRPTYARPPSEFMNPDSPNYKPGLEEQWLGLNQGGVPNTPEGFGKDGRPLPATPEYMKGFVPPRQQTMDSRMYTLNGKQMSGSSTYISALKQHLESIGQGNLFSEGLQNSNLTGQSSSTPVNLWGAPTGYDPSQQQNIFNPYSLGNNQYYNPYSFGGINTGTQDGTGEVPWWQNYNTGGTGVTPPTVTPPTTPTQPTGNGGGGGRQGKDLTYAETIKEMGLYPNAEKAFEAGDNQAAYRQDHMQWRSGTGAWAGNGKKAGESDGDYPGRTVGNNVIKGDKQRMAELMGLGNLFMGNGNGMLKRTPNDKGGNDYTVAGDGTFVTPGGTTVETQLTRDSNLAAQEAFQGFNSDMLRRGNRLPFGENTNIFGPAAPNGEQLSQTMVAQDDSGMFSISDIPNSYSNIRGGDRSGSAPTIQPAPTTQYEAGPAETRYGVNNSRELIESNLFGVNKPTAVEDAYNQRRFLLMKQESEKQAAMAESKRAAEEYEAKNRAEAAAKAAADAAAAQKRKNDNYETGYVPPNIFTSGTGGSSSGRGSRGGRRR